MYPTSPFASHGTYASVLYEGVTKSDGSGGTKRGGNILGVGNGVDIVNGDGLDREIQERNGDRRGN